ncbi:hypothetical protein [Methylorubrum populi]|uniref:hypothetical protein n=1 Tax=Methylorubrum populi TaxID=223967 RepID=UPI000DB754F7|nr:hypothetical protein [Methylorubrum populi]PZP71744.1 MAG: hypothetical protein DI590_05635 [Methylorubrum populi]
MSDAINAALAAAENAAAELPETTSSTTAVTSAPIGGAPAVAGQTRSLTDFMESSSMNVEVYLAVSHLGIRLGKDIKVHDEIEVEMCFKDAKAGYTLRVNTPNGVQYLTSWDGAVEARSRQNWAAVQADAKKMDGNSYVSDLIELPVKLLKDYPRKEGGPLAAGSIVGLSISYKNSQAFAPFLKENYPKFGADKPFKVKLTAVAKKGGGGQDYGVFGYEVIDEGKAGKKAA